VTRTVFLLVLVSHCSDAAAGGEHIISGHIIFVQVLVSHSSDAAAPISGTHCVWFRMCSLIEHLLFHHVGTSFTL
jgi:hypothetical protein